MRVIIWAILAAAVSACAGPQRLQPAAAAPGDTSGEASCPTVDTDVDEAQCAGLPADFGLNRHTPVEWGRRAASGAALAKGRPLPNQFLYFGRLTCADGTDPVILSRSMGGAPATRSNSPLSTDATKIDAESPDILDYWKVQCGDTLIRMYSNMYRCGSPCAPAGFRVIPAGAWASFQRGTELQGQGDQEGALAAFEAAVQAYPHSLKLQENYVFTLLHLQRHEEGLARAEEGLRHLPDGKFLRLFKAMSLTYLGRLDEAEETLRDIFVRIPPDDPFQAAVLCHQASIHRRRGDTEDADETRDLACKLGAKACCPRSEEEEPPGARPPRGEPDDPSGTSSPRTASVSAAGHEDGGHAVRATGSAQVEAVSPGP